MNNKDLKNFELKEPFLTMYSEISDEILQIKEHINKIEWLEQVKINRFKNNPIIMEGASWGTLDCEAINNYLDSIKIDDRKWNEKEKCYTSKIHLEITEDSLLELLEIYNHKYKNCLPDCKYCKEQEVAR